MATKKGVFIEPRDEYDSAIVKGKRGKPVYSYYRLVLITFEVYDLPSLQEAVEWVDYNILGVLDDDQIKYVRDHEKELNTMRISLGENEYDGT